MAEDAIDVVGLDGIGDLSSIISCRYRSPCQMYASTFTPIDAWRLACVCGLKDRNIG